MVTTIILFGALTLLTGLVILVDPESLFGLLRRHQQRPWLQGVAVGVRALLGALLLAQAAVSRFPLTIEMLGWLSLIAAAMLALIGRDRFTRLMAWALSLTGRIGRAGGVLAAGFGAFLIYAFV